MEYDLNVDITKICTSCERRLPANREHFHAYKRSKDGCRSVCRDCRAKDHAAHREERSEKKKKHYRENKERLLVKIREYYQENKDHQQKLGRERHHRNREKRLKQMQEYRSVHVEELNARKRPKALESWRSRYGADLEFTLKHRLRALIRVTLTKGREGKRMYGLLGYNASDLKEHIEKQFNNGMSWDSFLNGEIHIDHIRPVSSFNITDTQSPDFKECWALSNLRPLWAVENLKKGAKVQ